MIEGTMQVKTCRISACVIKDDDLSYSGLTNGIHKDSSTSTLAGDFELLKMLQAFKPTMCTVEDCIVKPIVLITADGGPCKNSHFPKMPATAC